MSCVVVLSFSKVIPSHPCFTAPCVTHSCLRTSPHRFLHVHPVRRLLLCRSSLRRVHPQPLCKEGYALADWLNNPLSHVSPARGPQFAQHTHDYTLPTRTRTPESPPHDLSHLTKRPTTHRHRRFDLPLIELFFTRHMIIVSRITEERGRAPQNLCNATQFRFSILPHVKQFRRVCCSRSSTQNRHHNVSKHVRY